MGDGKTESAENRSDWAEDRTILSNERTFASWMRTGMACIALALGLRAIFGDADLNWHPARLVASLFCVIALAMFWTARRKAAETLGRLNDHAARPVSTRNITLLAAMLGAGALGTLILLWII